MEPLIPKTEPEYEHSIPFLGSQMNIVAEQNGKLLLLSSNGFLHSQTARRINLVMFATSLQFFNRNNVEKWQKSQLKLQRVFLSTVLVFESVDMEIAFLSSFFPRN